MLYIICGHLDGKDSGAVACDGKTTESTITRQIGKKIALLGGDNVTLLPTDIDHYTAQTLNKESFTISDTDYILELHCDSSDNTNARGGHVVISNRFEPDEYDIALSELCNDTFSGRAELITPRSDLYNCNVSAIRGFNYRLLEMCFITNSDDFKKISDETFQLSYAEKILNCFNITANTAHTNKIRIDDQIHSVINELTKLLTLINEVI